MSEINITNLFFIQSMQDVLSYSVFWDVMLTFLGKLKENPSKLQDLLGDKYEAIPQDVLDIYILIATIGLDQGLDFDYIEDGENGEELYCELIKETSFNYQEVLDYYLPILQMFKETVHLIVVGMWKDTER